MLPEAALGCDRRGLPLPVVIWGLKQLAELLLDGQQRVENRHLQHDIAVIRPALGSVSTAKLRSPVVAS